MEAQTFLDNFGTIARAPGGIDLLRQLVLNLAVRGALVEQDLGEEPVEIALCSLRETKSEFLKAKVQGRTKIPRVVDDSERTSEVPNGWSWARIDDTGQYVNGLAFKAADWQDSGIPIIRIQNLSDPSKEFNYTHGNHPADRMVVTGDLLVSWSATLDVFVWDRGDGAVNQHIFKVIPEERVVAKNFLFYLLKHTIQVLAASDALHGLAMKHINRGPFVSHPVLIPPLAEQHRIVAKVDELMALCDQLETQQQTHTQTTTKLQASALNALTTAETADDLQTAWERIHTNWGACTDDLGSVDKVRELILNLAIRGHLIKQHSDDEHVDQLLVRLASEKNRLAQEGAIRLPKSVPAVDKEEEPFAVPPSWVWVRLADVAWPQTGFTFKSYQFNESGHGTPLIRIGDIGNLTTQAHFDGEFREEFLVDTGDYLIGMSGNFNVRKWAGPRALLNQRVARLVFFGREVRARFVAVALQQWLYELHESYAYTTLRNLSGKQLAQSPIPLPPLEEQRRIVAKVDELIALCDELDARLVERDRLGEALAASVVDAFAA